MVDEDVILDVMINICLCSLSTLHSTQSTVYGSLQSTVYSLQFTAGKYLRPCIPGIPYTATGIEKKVVAILRWKKSY